MEEKNRPAPPAEAAEGFLRAVMASPPPLKTENIAPQAAAGRVTARAVYALAPSPGHDVSLADGAALASDSTARASKARPLTLAGLRPVATGEPLPPGCDCVLMREELLPGGDRARLEAPVEKWHNVKRRGEDAETGQLVLGPGRLLRPADIGALLSAGITELEVTAVPTAGVLSFPGLPWEANAAVYAAMLESWGARARRYGPETGLAKAAGECSLLLVCAPSRALAEIIEAELGEQGEILYSGLAVKPGSTTVLGRLGNVPVILVPGYQPSGITALSKIARPLLYRLRGLAPPPAPAVTARLTRGAEPMEGFDRAIRVKLGIVDENYIAAPMNRASLVGAFAGADGMFLLPAGKRLEAGERAEIELLRPENELRRAVIAAGSRDPALGELACALTELSGGELSFFGGAGASALTALARGEAHVAFIRLFDAVSGEYNLPFFRRAFPEGGAVLCEGVGRREGFLVARGNPKGIVSPADAARPDFTLANRRRGSGARLLTRYILASAGVEPERVKGWDTQELSELDAAGAVAAGRADAAYGGLSSARALGLDFVPLHTARLDMAAPLRAWETSRVQRLAEALSSPLFTGRLEALGGYEAGSPGRLLERI